jgi:hypothetical protein
MEQVLLLLNVGPVPLYWAGGRLIAALVPRESARLVAAILLVAGTAVLTMLVLSLGVVALVLGLAALRRPRLAGALLFAFSALLAPLFALGLVFGGPDDLTTFFAVYAAGMLVIFLPAAAGILLRRSSPVALGDPDVIRGGSAPARS